MSHTDILYLAVAAVVIGGIGVVRSLRHRARSADDEPLVVRSLVRVITDEEELREALERATHFEEMVANAVQHRADRYRSMVTTASASSQTSSRKLEAGGFASSLAGYPPRRGRRRVSDRLDDKLATDASERALG